MEIAGDGEQQVWECWGKCCLKMVDVARHHWISAWNRHFHDAQYLHSVLSKFMHHKTWDQHCITTHTQQGASPHTLFKLIQLQQWVAQCHTKAWARSERGFGSMNFLKLELFLNFFLNFFSYRTHDIPQQNRTQTGTDRRRTILKKNFNQEYNS